MVIKTNTNFQLIFSNVLIAHINASMIKPKYIFNNFFHFNSLGCKHGQVNKKGSLPKMQFKNDNF
jgi:hypothetical protein